MIAEFLGKIWHALLLLLLCVGGFFGVYHLINVYIIKGYVEIRAVLWMLLLYATLGLSSLTILCGFLLLVAQLAHI